MEMFGVLHMEISTLEVLNLPISFCGNQWKVERQLLDEISPWFRF